MVASRVPAELVGLPEFAVEQPVACEAFDLSSHARAGKALALGLATPGISHNLFVVGPDRAGRMTATRAYVQRWASTRPEGQDWLYLFNFDAPHAPLPLPVPPATGSRFADAVEALIPALAEALAAAFADESYQQRVQSLRSQDEARLRSEYSALEADARAAGLALHNTQQGAVVNVVDAEGNVIPLGMVEPEQRAEIEAKSQEVMERLAELNRQVARLQRRFVANVQSFNRVVAEQTASALTQGLLDQFAPVPALHNWLQRLVVEVAEHHRLFLAEDGTPAPALPLRRFGVNLLVDRTGAHGAPVIMEHNPTYENLFGRIEYRQIPGGGLDTDVSLIRGGALHAANGGVIILRAEALAGQPALWEYLKAALRDREVRIEEFYRAGSPPIAGAPRPVAVPLDVKVVLVGSSGWYYGFFSRDPEFSTYFRIKAEIEEKVPATPGDLRRYLSLVLGEPGCEGLSIEEPAIRVLLGMASRWAADREQLTAQYERVADLAQEARQLVGAGGPLNAEAVRQAVADRRARNALIEDRVHEAIEKQITIIDLSGHEVGQINGLTVQTVGDHAFGTPARITARSSVGRRGVINIERLVAMSGPIQQKGSMVLQGILMRRFARRMPLSFDCSVTFEQMYGGVEGDSASMAEFIAIISDLADLPIRQDLAITGSINQLGEAQVIGGLHHKIEGFFRACRSAGPLTGEQGVVIPVANRRNLVLRDEVREAVEQGQFHIWSVSRVEEALALFTGVAVGEEAPYGAETVYGRVLATLEGFDRALRERGI